MPKKKSSKQRAKSTSGQNEPAGSGDNSPDLEPYIERRGFFWEPRVRAKTVKGLMTLLRQVSEESTLDRQLDRIEQETKLILSKEGYPAERGELADIMRKQSVPYIVEDAARVLTTLNVLRQMVSSGEHKDAVVLALNLGALHQRLKIRLVEKSLLQGIATTEGHVASRKTRSEKMKDRIKVEQECVDELHRQHPNWNFGPLCAEAVQKVPHKVHPDTLRKHVRNPLKKDV